jgi:hypothetical protein
LDTLFIQKQNSIACIGGDKDAPVFVVVPGVVLDGRVVKQLGDSKFTATVTGFVFTIATTHTTWLTGITACSAF